VFVTGVSRVQLSQRLGNKGQGVLSARELMGREWVGWSLRARELPQKHEPLR